MGEQRWLDEIQTGNGGMCGRLQLRALDAVGALELYQQSGGACGQPLYRIGHAGLVLDGAQGGAVH